MQSKLPFSIIICQLLIFSRFYVNLENNIISYFFFVLWIASMCLENSTKLFKSLGNRIFIYLIVFWVYYWLIKYINLGVSSAFNNLLESAILYSPALMLFYYSTSNNKTTKFILATFGLIILVDSFFLYKGIQRSPLGLRLVEGDDGAIKNSFHLVNIFGIAIPSLSYIILKRNLNKTVRVILCIFLVISVYILIKSLFFTSLIVCFLSCVIFLLYGQRAWLIKTCTVIFVCLSIFVLGFDSLMSILNASSFSNTPITAEKLYEINSILTSAGDEAADFNVRNQHMNNSFNLFLEHFLFGIESKTKDLTERMNMGLGNHSQWVDMLARYGLFALLIFMFLLKLMIRQYKDIKIPYMLPFVLIGFLNPVLSFIEFYTTFFLLPTLYRFIDQKCDQL